MSVHDLTHANNYQLYCDKMNVNEVIVPSGGDLEVPEIATDYIHEETLNNGVQIEVLKIKDNVLSSINANEDILIQPNGTGKVNMNNAQIDNLFIDADTIQNTAGNIALDPLSKVQIKGPAGVGYSKWLTFADDPALDQWGMRYDEVLGGDSNMYCVLDSNAATTRRFQVGYYPADLEANPINNLFIASVAGAATNCSFDLPDAASFYSVNGSTVLTKTALGSTVLASSLTSTGTLSTLNVNGAARFSNEATVAAFPAAAPLTCNMLLMTSTATGNALSLAAGAVGQVISFYYVAEAAGADTIVLTPALAVGYTTITFNAIGDSACLQYTSAGWQPMGLKGAVFA